MGGSSSSPQRNGAKSSPEFMDGTAFRETVPVVLVSDIGQDLDDEMCMIMVRYLVEKQFVDLLGVVATLTPSFDRARLCRGCLDLLGLKSVPIGVGSDGGDLKGQHLASTFEQSASSYMPAPHSEIACSLEPGMSLLSRIYEEASPRTLRLVIIASLKDPALFLRDNEELFAEKTKEVIIMGGVEPFDSGPAGDTGGKSSDGFLKPDTAHNNMFDSKASAFFYRRCQELGVRLIVVSRHAAYPAQMPRSVYDDLAHLGSSIGWRLRNAQRSSVEALWVRANSEGDERLGLPPRCDRTWFLKTFCGGEEAERGKNDCIWDLIVSFNQYDTLALIVAVPELRERFFDPIEVPILVADQARPSTECNLIIGKSPEEHNIRDPEDLLAWMTQGFNYGLALDHHHKSQVIILMQARWDNLPDLLLTCVVLRALYSLGVMDCMGVVVSLAPQDLGAQRKAVVQESLSAQVLEIQTALMELGLGHVPVLAVRNSMAEKVDMKVPTAEAVLEELYAKAPVAGVTVLVTASASQINDFASNYTTQFRTKTQAVVLVGGAKLTRHSVDAKMGTCLDEKMRGFEPDPQAWINSYDLPAVKCFFHTAQRTGVPLIVVSEHLSQAVRMPMEFVKVLEDHGGSLGRRLAKLELGRVKALRERCRLPPDDPGRAGLPRICDENWFSRNFLVTNVKMADEELDRQTDPTPTDKMDALPLEAIDAVTIHNPLALLASLPFVMEQYMVPQNIVVRSAKHTFVGLSEANPGVKSSKELRKMFYQCVFKGLRANMSEFDMGTFPTIPIVLPGGIEPGSTGEDPEGPEEDNVWSLEASEKAMSDLRPAAFMRYSSKADVNTRARRWLRFRRSGEDGASHYCCFTR